MSRSNSPRPASRSPNIDLIGKRASAYLLDTPALILDLDVLESNIAAMSEWARKWNVRLRPHAKTHKCAAIARQQLAAGAVGICVAKLGEAMRMAELGCEQILITSPIVTDRKIDRLVALNDSCDDLMVVVDNVQIVEKLEAAFAGKKPLNVLIDRGMGVGYHNRTGAFTIEDSVSLAEAISGSSNMVLRGLQAYAGALQHIDNFEERRAAAKMANEKIRNTRDVLAKKGHCVDIVTGGGTGSCEFDSETDIFTDLQVGSYIFLDVEYNEVKHGPAFPEALATSLFLQTTVISANLAGRSTTDAGFKSFATDGPLPIIASGATSGSEYVFMGDEHGCVIVPDGEQNPSLGGTVRCVTPHCDPTVNLHDFYHCIRGDTLVDIWPIDARGQLW